MDHRDLLAIARRQLRLSKEAPVPLEYLEELRTYIQEYPDNTNFWVTAQPCRGFGYVNCLEDGCLRLNIPLGASATLRDGGKSLGIGSLGAYKRHIDVSPTHISARNARLAALAFRDDALPMSSPPTTPKRASHMTASYDNDQEVATPTKTTSSPIRPLYSRVSSFSIKPEPMEPSIPRKRSFDLDVDAPLPALFPRKDDEGQPSDKKPKLEPLNLPLHDKNRKSPDMPYVQDNRSTNNVEDTRAILADIISRISSVQAALRRARRKSKPTKSDHTRIAKMELELNDLYAQREACNDNIPSARPATGVATVKTETEPVAKIEHAIDMGPIASGSNVQLPPAAGRVAYLDFDGDEILQPVPYGSEWNHNENPPIPANPDAYFSDESDYDESGNWHGRGRETYHGPVAKADDIDKFLVAAGNSEQFDGNASVDTALKKLNLKNLYQPLAGMTVALMPHQAIGVAWMLEQERSSFKGGTLADEMGLGKTVQMISVLATNRSDDPLCKSTLIICPVALLDQWEQEIAMKTDLGLSCLIYHGNNKPKRVKDIQKYDVVLTTFHTLAYEWPDFDAEEKERQKAARKNKELDGFIINDVKSKKKKRGAKKQLGLLFHVNWFRVCIDEAQNIRNRRTRVSRAVDELEATYRWCLTGTPIINGLSDAYPLLRFLKIRPWYDWNEFYPKIGRHERKQPNLATRRLQAVFKIMLLRRKKDSELDGEKLIQLPARNLYLRKLQFSQEERDIYAMVEANAQAKFNRFLRAGTVLKNYHCVLVLLLRLRQLCSHPSLIQEAGDGFVYADEVEHGGDKTGELARAAHLVSLEFVNQMKKKFKEIVLERMAAEAESADASLDEECPICYDTLTDVIVTCCGHVFCRDCMLNVLNGPARQDAEEPSQYKPDERPCPTCRGPVSQKMMFSRQAFEPTDDELTFTIKGKAKSEDADVIDLTAEDDHDVEVNIKAPIGRTLRKRTTKPLRIYDSDEEIDQDDDLSDFIVDDDEDEEEAEARIALKRSLRKGKGKRRAIILSDDEDEDIIFGAKPSVPIPPEKVKMMPRFLPSTKMKYMMDCLMAWSKEHPDEKTLVISQWTQCLDLVSKYLAEHGFAHVKYQGDMTRHQRDASVRNFMSKDKASVMLMSLKCGGVGLNLTRASRVISLDLAWSEAIENQAFDRVHRLGQMRAVNIERLVIQDTVEDRILSLQERKRNLADGSLGEGNGQKIGRLTVKELAMLFNVDTQGNVLT